MGSVKIFTKAQCPKCPEAKAIALALKNEGVRVLQFDLDTVEGLAEASFHSVLSTPSLIVEDEEEREMAAWRGKVPSLQEVRACLVRKGL